MIAVIRSSKGRQYKDQQKMVKKKDTVWQNPTQKTRDWATWTPIKADTFSCAPDG